MTPDNVEPADAGGVFLAVRGLPRSDGTTLPAGFVLDGLQWVKVTDAKAAQGSAVARGEQLEKAAAKG